MICLTKTRLPLGKFLRFFHELRPCLLPALILVLLAARGNAAPDPMMDRYADYFKRWCEADIGAIAKWEKQGFVAGQLPDQMIRAVAPAVVFEYTHDPKYSECAARWYALAIKSLATTMEKNERPDFHIYRCFGTMLYYCHTRGLITSADRPILVSYAKFFFSYGDKTEGLGAYWDEG